MTYSEFDPNEWPERGLFRGSGSMNYPEGEMEYVWDGRGTAGSSADCLITAAEVRLRPKRMLRTVLGWPEVVLPRQEIRGFESTFAGRYRFRSDNKLLDGACFRPIGSRPTFLAALQSLGIPHLQLSWWGDLALEMSAIWNQMRWGGRLRRRHWNHQQ